MSTIENQPDASPSNPFDRASSVPVPVPQPAPDSVPPAVNAERHQTRSPRTRLRKHPDLTLAFADELRILTALRADLTIHHESLDDPDLMVVLAEGQTSLLELLDHLLELDLHDEALICALKGNRDTLAVRLHRFEERRRSRRVVLEQALVLLERTSLERPTGTINLVDRPPSLIVDEEGVVPAKFFDLKPVLNRRLVKEALEAGAEIPGVRLSGRAVTLTLRRR